ncbi:MAG: PAS domain S-box protein [Deltaproteobacteria bacterium]|nr:PAS domain S-box protein [Deltaproteobacteria bacterium]
MRSREDETELTHSREILGAVDALVLVTDEALTLHYANQAARELLGDEVARIFSDAPWEEVPRRLSASTAGDTLALETTLIDVGGARHQVAWSIREPSLPGQARRFVCTGLDVTELRESEERYRWLSSSTIEGITIHERGVIQDVNARCSEMWGYTIEEMIGRSVLDFATEASRPIILDRIKAGLEGPYEVVGQRKDGSTFPLEIVTRHTQYRGKLARVAGLRDISERKRIEHEHAQLEARIRQAQRMEAVGILAGGVAHDFNNLLSVIMGLSDVLALSPEASPQMREDLGRIQEAANLGSRLTRELLLFARPEPAADEGVDVAACLHKVAGLIRQQARRELTLEISLPDEVWAASGRTTHVEQVLLNICINARDAMPEGGSLLLEAGNVQLQTSRAVSSGTLPAGDYVCLSVTDSGEGMDEDTLAKLFEPFYSTRRAEGRSGLGLAVVFGLVTGCGGGVQVESRPGEGTRFDVYLPRSRRRGSESAPSEPEVGQARGRTIAVVEDQPDVLGVIVRVLEMAGHRVLAASSGLEAEALFSARGDEVELLVCDVIMPGLSGPELIRRLATTYPDLPVLYISGYSDQALDLHDLTGADLLAKPFRPVDLLAKVETLLA